MTPEAENDRVGDLLTRALPPGPDPDAARLAALRAASIAAFAEVPPTSPRRTTPMTHLLRLAAGLIAAGVAFALVNPSPPPPDPVRRALDEIALADRHFRLAEETGTRDLFNRAADLRFDETPERYTLVQGDAAFAVDEAANRYTPLAAADRDRLRDSGWDVRASAVVGSMPRPGGTTYALDPPAEVDLDAAGKFVALRRYAAGRLVATLTLVGNAPPAADDKFALKNTLSEDGRVGKVTDVQGLASLKPVGAARFTPLRPNALVLPGDYLQVDARGANAATVRLLPEATLIVGPGSIVEVLKPTKLRLLQGEVEVTPAKGTPVELLGPGDTALTLNERGFYRLTGDKLARVPADPVWLKSLKGASVAESLGSLVAQVDGRAVSLSVGVHKVTVEVRDQIARTTIEETFVNHTASQLEGVFHFPLPQDASIAGFAMWIGNEKVEADVVEKQRAREIFETILREKRDPGLLEWAGGNLFKARVFPIFAHSEKRISITYTQVLPAVGNAVRYSYALQSEMLRLNPLKELSVTFTVSSALPLKAVTSPTHSCRSAFAGTSAKLEFVAKNYTPTKDFEAVIELADAAPAVTLIPHRRGSDGYFLLQVTPPAPPQSGRALVASDAPLSLLLWCDTSASIDAGQRRTQAALAGALLTALTPKDSFDLAVTDVATLFAFGKPTPATPENVGKARDFLAKRASLGWSNLEGGLTAVLAQSPPGTHVVYLGDGVAGTVAADPQAAAVRLDEAYKLAAKPVTVHAVALGSGFESGVLARLASLGGGSSRRVGGDQTPTKVALDILGEVTRPPVRNVKVAFTGLKTAKVYPELLPNLTPGTQQILLGRYLPEGTDQRGEVTVTGTQAGREVRFTAPVTLKDAEAGNLFLPRLWARLHLDALLEGPQTPATKDAAIGLSEEFHIMTPYTSFLVLESDADRARFAVKRRFEMRDGEQFFAAGKATATYTLAREQMKVAGLWRAGLRRQVLNRLANLDRPALAVQSQQWLDEFGLGNGRRSGMFSVQANVNSDPGINGQLGLRLIDGQAPLRPNDRIEPPTNSPVGGRMEIESLRQVTDESQVSGGGVMPGRSSGVTDESPVSREKGDKKWDFAETDGKRQLGRKELRDSFDGIEMDLPGLQLMGDLSNNRSELNFGLEDAAKPFGGRGRPGLFAGDYATRALVMRGTNPYHLGLPAVPKPYPPRPSPIDALFPSLPGAPTDAVVKSPWPKDATDLATLVFRRPTLAALAGGLSIERSTQYFTPRQATAESRSTELVSPKRWATRHETDTAATTVEWCDGATRAVLNAAFHLARSRAGKPADLTHPPVNGHDLTMWPLWEQYAGTAKVEAGSVLVVASADGRFVVRVTIDAAKRVVTRVESSYEGAPATTVTTFADFVQVRGQWWATTIESAIGGKVQSRIKQAVTETADAAFATAFDALTALQAKCVGQREPVPTLAAAKAALAAAQATTDDRFALLRQTLAYQRYEEAAVELDAIDKLEAGKPGLTWLRIVLQMASRRNEEARQRMLAAVPEVLALPTPGDRIALAQWLTHQAANVLSYPEQRQLRDRFAPLFAALPVTHGTRRDWMTLSYYVLVNAGLGVEAFDYLKALVAEDPTNFAHRVLFLRLMFDRGERDAAYAGLREQLAAKDAWDKSEVGQLYGILTEFQEREGKLPAKLETLTAWVAFAPDDEAAAWQLLSALVRTDAGPKADALVAQWIAEAKVAAPMSTQVAKCRAALRHATGQADRLPTDRIDPKWVAVLVDAARFFFAQEKPTGLDRVVLGNHLFQQTDAAPKLFVELFDRVLNAVAERPLPRLAADLQWLQTVPAVERDRWVKLVAAVKSRWAATADDDAKYALGQQLAQLVRSRLGSEESLAFTRERLRAAPAKHRRWLQTQLFAELQNFPANDARVNEAYDLVPAFLAGDDDKPVSPAEAVARLMQLDDWSLQTRTVALQAEVKNPERLTRPELKAKLAETTRQARGELIDRLTKREATYPAALKPWATLERLTVQARHDADPNAIAAELFTLLGAAPLAAPAEDAEVTPTQALAFELQARAVALALHAVTRPAIKPEAVTRLRAYLDAGIAAHPKADGWKQTKYDLLIALDLPKDLEDSLTAWARAGDPVAQWRTALGHLLAELGRLKEAIAVFESIQEIDAAAYGRSMALARLYMAVDDQAKHAAAKADAYRQLTEQQLGQLLHAKYQSWQPRQGVALPTELDADTLPILAALIDKATNVDRYFGTVQALYQASKDFRIPATVADASLGQTAGKVYAVVLRMQSLLNDVRDEAAADTVFARIEALRPKAKSPTDLRVLDLIAMQIHRRAAAAVQNQPGPHAELALAAFRRAYDRPWAEGEKLLMAKLLFDLYYVPSEALAVEQLRQLKGLHDAAPRGTVERLQIAEWYAEILRVRGKWVDAIGVLTPVVAEFVAATKGRFTAESLPAARRLANLCREYQGHAEAEKLWLGWRVVAANEQVKLTIENALNALYAVAFEQDGAVLIGKGEALYVALLGRLNARLRDADPNERWQTLDAYGSLFRVAGAKVYARTGADVLALANGAFPELIKPWDESYPNHVQTVATLVRDHAGIVNAWSFLLDRIEALPAWLRHGRRGGWNLGQWARNQNHAMPLDLPAPLEARLLKVVLAELTDDLRSPRQHHRDMVDARYGYYWSAKEAEFAAVAEAVLAGAKDSVPTQLYVAEYLFHGCHRTGRAIDVLAELHRAKRLDVGSRNTLSVYLMEVSRFAEAVEVLVPLIDDAPDDTATRFRLMTAYFHLGKPAELRDLFGRSVGRWKEHDRWTIAEIPGFGDAAQACDMHREAADLYAELIPNVQRLQGSPNATLAEYYRRHAVSLTKVGKAVEAVDAASGAVVAWGGDTSRRQAALVTLNATVQQAANLEALVAHFDEQQAETGLVNPVLRKALGQAYAARQNYAPAITQLELAVEAQPNDPETFTALIACYDAMNRKPDAIARILQSLDLTRRDLVRYEDLGTRYAAASDPASAERAVTSLVEVTRGESEGQALLARIRQRQDRWAEAIPHWEQVNAVRSLEPAGLIGLAEAQLHLKQFDAARATLQKLRAKTWPSHTGDTPAKVRELEARLPKP